MWCRSISVSPRFRPPLPPSAAGVSLLHINIQILARLLLLHSGQERSTFTFRIYFVLHPLSPLTISESPQKFFMTYSYLLIYSDSETSSPTLIISPLYLSFTAMLPLIMTILSPVKNEKPTKITLKEMLQGVSLMWNQTTWSPSLRNVWAPKFRSLFCMFWKTTSPRWTKNLFLWRWIVSANNCQRK